MPAESEQIFSRHRIDRESVRIVDHDFVRPTRLAAEVRRGLLMLHERLAREASAAFSEILRTSTTVRAASFDSTTPAAFLAGQPDPSVLAVLEAAPGGERVAVEMSPLIVYPMVDRLLGGTGEDLHIPERAMTAIEARLLRRLLERLAEALQAAWPEEARRAFRITAVESSPQLTPLTSVHDAASVVGLEVRMGRRAGMMSMCLPQTLIGSLDGPMAGPSVRRRAPSADRSWRARLIRAIGSAPVELTAAVAGRPVTLDGVRRWEVGDHLVLGVSGGADIVVTVEGSPKFRARLDGGHPNRAIRLTTPPPGSDPDAARRPTVDR